MNSYTSQSSSPIPPKGSNEWNMLRDFYATQWRAAKSALDRAKEEESRLREQFVTFAFDATKTKGTETIELAGGYKAKCIKREYYYFKPGHGFDNVADTAEYVLLQIAELGPDHKFIADRLVRWVPELQVGEYNKLKSPAAIELIQGVIEVKQGQPSLEVIPPKGFIT